MLPRTVERHTPTHVLYITLLRAKHLTRSHRCIESFSVGGFLSHPPIPLHKTEPNYQCLGSVASVTERPNDLGKTMCLTRGKGDFGEFKMKNQSTENPAGRNFQLLLVLGLFMHPVGHWTLTVLCLTRSLSFFISVGVRQSALAIRGTTLTLSCRAFMNSISTGRSLQEHMFFS